METELRKMAAKCSKSTTFFLLIVFSLFLDSNADQGWGRLSKQEDLKLDRQLRLLNKPAIKSFKTQYGDIVDCIDIYKQLAFDHPLLKNHTIQMKPKTNPKGMKDKGSRTDVFPAYGASISCPPKSIPIKRTTKEDLIMHEYQKFARSNYATKKLDDRGFHSAVMVLPGKIYGAKAGINIWNPTVSNSQYSRAGIEIVQNSNTIFAGWEVRKWNYSRLYISWSGVDGFCNHHICPGFVQVNHKTVLGDYLTPSTFQGHQYELRISLFQDIGIGNWWFMLRDQLIGYWPKELFSPLAGSINKFSCGGQVYSPTKELTPAMGSGHFSHKGLGQTAFIRGIKVITNKTRAYDDPDRSTILTNIAYPSCYNARYQVGTNPQWGHHLFFGGHGRCLFN